MSDRAAAIANAVVFMIRDSSGGTRTILEPRRIAGKTLAAWKSGFAILGRGLVVHLVADGEKQRSLLSRLGKHKMGKAGLDSKQLADPDRSVLEELVVGSIADARRRYGEDDDA